MTRRRGWCASRARCAPASTSPTRKRSPGSSRHCNGSARRTAARRAPAVSDLELEGARSSPFPERGTETVRIDSVAEAYAYFTAWPPPDGQWEHVGQVFAPGPAGPEDHLTVRA